MREVWRVVPGFPHYKASNTGKIKRFIPGKRNHACKVLKPWLNNKGYEIVTLVNDKGQSKVCVHRIVCITFHGNAPTTKHEVGHRNGNCRVNNSANLRWVTRSENMADAKKHGTMAIGAKHGRTTKPERTSRGETHGHAVLSKRKVLAIRKAQKSKGVDLAKKYGVSAATISVIRNRKTWSHV